MLDSFWSFFNDTSTCQPPRKLFSLASIRREGLDLFLSREDRRARALSFRTLLGSEYNGLRTFLFAEAASLNSF